MTAKRAPVRAVPDAEDNFVREPFEYPLGRSKIVLPSLTWLKPGLLRKVRRLGGTDRLYTLLEELLDEKHLELVDDMEPDDFAEMCKQWNDHSKGVGLGES